MPTLSHDITKAEQAAISEALNMLRDGKPLDKVGAFIDAEQAKLNNLRAGGNPVTTVAEDAA